MLEFSSTVLAALSPYQHSEQHFRQTKDYMAAVTYSQF